MKRTLAFCLILAFIVVGLSVQAATLGTRPKSTFSDTSTTTTGPAWTYSASALTSGIGWQLTNAGSTVTGTSMDILSTGLTSGSALRIRLDNDNLTTGKYINCLGGSSYDTAVFTIGEDGATAITSAVATTNSLSITNNVSTAGDLLTLTLDNDTADADTFYISMLGGTDHATSVLTIGENAVMTFGDGGTIDGVTGTDVINITESTVRVTGVLDVTQNSTLASVDVGGAYSGGSGATISAAGVIQANGAITTDGLLTAGSATITGLATLNTIKYGTINTDATGTVPVAAADTGELFVATKADGATTYTLPDPSAATVGCVWTFMQTADQNMNIVPTTANGNSIIGLNVATSDKVSIETGGAKIGGMIQIIGISATKYFAVGLSAPAVMTVEAAD